MNIFAYAATGFVGSLVSVEVDIRRGIPGLDIVGLPDNAVRESRDRVRVALRRSGFQFPADRILVNLSPAGLKKEGTSYDLPIAIGILAASGQMINFLEDDFLCSGELLLDGSVRAVEGILPAVAVALDRGMSHFIVPLSNLPEASILVNRNIIGMSHLRDILHLPVEQKIDIQPKPEPENVFPLQELAELSGQPILRRALETAAAGRHNLLLFGPPGCGKTMAARAMEGLSPEMDDKFSLEVSRIWSQAGKLTEPHSLIKHSPFREPHHSSSSEGVIGGGRAKYPGEVSLAHGGILFLDETPEFGPRVLQALREPLESRRVELARAGISWWYPADFQLLMAMNPCPCGNLGREDATCLCTPPEISRYWRRLGGALLDRVEIRVPVSPVSPDALMETAGESSMTVRERVNQARKCQKNRYARKSWKFNADIPPGELNGILNLDNDIKKYFQSAVRKLGISSRGIHSVLRVSRTLADLERREEIILTDILEALQHRRYGDRDLFWTTV